MSYEVTDNGFCADISCYDIENIQDCQQAASALDWSFPPHWRNSMVALVLCLGRRVPRLDGNVLANIVDCCGRAWFLNLKRERDRQRKRILGSGGRPPLRAKLLASAESYTLC